MAENVCVYSNTISSSIVSYVCNEVVMCVCVCNVCVCVYNCFLLLLVVLLMTYN
jgi:hypothetical protein